MTESRSHNLAAHLLLVSIALVWGVTFSLVKAALGEVAPLLFNLLRMGLAFVILLAVNHRSLRGLSRRELRLGAAAGLLLGCGYQFQTVGLRYTTASISAFITGLVVVMVPLLSTLPGVNPGSARPRPGVYAGALLAFAGVVLLAAPGSGRPVMSGFELGEWLTLCCAAAFSAHMLTLARAARGEGAASLEAARRMGTLQIGFAAFMMLITLPLGGSPSFRSTATVWVALAVTALLGTAAAFTIQSWAQQHLPASHTALILTLEPVFAWATSMEFFGERLGSREMVGAALILGGILVSELRPASRGAAALRVHN